MTHDNPLSGENIYESIKTTSRQRRIAPLEFFKEFLSDIWMDNTEEEAFQQWRVKVEHYPWYADDALYCLDAVIANPPDNLVEIMQQHGWIMLYHESEDSVEPYAFDEYLEWLKQMRDRFRAIYDSAPATRDDAG